MFDVIVCAIKRIIQDGELCWLSVGELRRETIACPIAAKATAIGQRRPGVAVMIRPRFNEPHLNLGLEENLPQLTFREWRSYDGGLFEEIHWLGMGGGPIKTPKLTRLDAEIILPPPPA